MATGAPGQARIVLSAEDQSAAAFAAVSRRFTTLQGDVLATKEKLAGIAATVGTVIAALSVKGRIDLLDQLDKLQEKTGLTSEQLSVLRYQGELANVPMEELAKGIQRLSKNMAEAAGGGVEATATFAAMGIKVRDGSGALKSQDVILGEIAEKFKSYEDGAAKAALAQRIFGKTGADMIPLLNQGSDGLARQAKEAKELGLLFGGDLTRNADELNSNLARLKLTSEAAAIAIGGKLLPALNGLITTYLEMKKEGLLGTIIGDAAKDVFGFGKLTDDPNADLQKFAHERARILKDLDYMRRKGFPTDARQEDLGNIDDLIRVARIKQRGQILSNLPPGFENDAISRRLGKKTEAPVTKDPGGDRSEQILKKTLEARLKAIADFAELQKVGIEFGNTLAENAYAAGFLTVQELFDKQRQAREDGYANDTQALKANIAAQEALLRGTKNEDTRIAARGAIADAQSKLTKLEAENSNKKALAFEAERVATQRVKDAYDALGASVLDLEGKTLQATQARIEKQIRDEALTTAQAGGDQALVQRKRTLLQLTAELADVQQRYGRLTAQSSDAEALLLLNAQESGTTERDTLIALGVERQHALSQLKDLADEAAKLAESLQTPEAIAAARGLALAFKKAAAEADPLLVKTREVGKELGDAAANAGEEAILHWQGFASLLKSIEQQILQIILRSQVTKPLGDYLGNLLGGNGQQSGGGGILGRLFPGMFGADTSASLNDGIFGSMQDFVPGLATGTNYVPKDMLAVIHQGEAVVPKEYNNGASGMTFSPTFNIAGPVDQRTRDQIAVAAMQGAQRALARNG